MLDVDQPDVHSDVDPTDDHPLDVNQLLEAWSRGDRKAIEQLMPLVVDELRQVAANHMRRERPGHTLQPTALVNEVFLKLAERGGVQWKNRYQFFAVASKMMRHLLVDHAREKNAARRGGGVVRLSLDASLEIAVEQAVDLVALSDSLESLRQLAPRQAEVVEMRYFGGLKNGEIAELLGISTMTVKRDFAMARRFLFYEIREAKTSRET